MEFQSTLPRRRRLYQPIRSCRSKYFNPRFRVGSDIEYIETLPVLDLFQSTLPRRKRQRNLHQIYRFHRFQSTLPRRKRRKGTVFPEPGGGRFQSTLPRRKRQYPSCSAGIASLFQSTLPRRKRRSLPLLAFSVDRFQSTLPRRKRLHHVKIRRISGNFNPRFRVGSDHLRQMPQRQRQLFQSTLPRRKRLSGTCHSTHRLYISIHASA